MLRRGGDMTRTTNGRATLALALALAVPTSAHAADWWVAPDGDDAATGAMDDPWATIAHADEVIAAGDIVHVMAGEYSAAFDTNASGMEGAPIVFVSEPKWGARLVGAGGDGWIARGDWVDIVGFEVTGDAAVGMLSMGSHIRFLDNWVHHLAPMCDGNGGAGIDAGNYEAQDVDMIGNVVHDIWADDGDGGPCNRVQGLYHAHPEGTIANNIAWGNSGWGIHTWHNPRDLVITNNLVFANGDGGIIVGAGDSPGTGYADGFLVANNIVVYNPIGIYEYGATGLDNRYIANLVYENESDVILQNGLVAEGTVSADPLFVDWQIDGSGDYRLAPGSPAIDVGTIEGAPGTDIDGVPRPQGDGIDIGPHEVPVDVDTTGGDESTAGDEAVEETTGSLPGEASASDDDGVGTSTGDGAPTDDTGTSSGAAGADDDADGGCSCAAGTDSRALLVFGLLVLGVRRRRAVRGRPA
jgi:MYXO-CTERM domain-containing protein